MPIKQGPPLAGSSHRLTELPGLGFALSKILPPEASAADLDASGGSVHTKVKLARVLVPRGRQGGKAKLGQSLIQADRLGAVVTKTPH